MTPEQIEIVDIVKANMPLVRLFDRASISDRLDEKIMCGLGLSLRDYGEVLQMLEEDFKLQAPAPIRQEDNRHWRLAALSRRKNYDPSYTLRVPDLSINELVEIVRNGEWPLKYYERTDLP